MATLNLRLQADIVVGGETKQLGSTSTAQTITLSEIADHVLTVATATLRTLWQTAGGYFATEIATFDFLWIESNQDATVQLVTDLDNGDGGTNREFIELKADIPFVLAGDATRHGNATSPSTGTAGAVERIDIYQASGSDATIRFVIGKT